VPSPAANSSTSERSATVILERPDPQAVQRPLRLV
jgi:hypothetical protein